MRIDNSHSTPSWIVAVIILGFSGIFVYLNYSQRTAEQQAISSLMTFPVSELVAFKVRPDTSSSFTDQRVHEFHPHDEVVAAFFQALSDYQAYRPAHDTSVAHWGIQLQTATAELTMWCYIPADTPGIAIGNVQTASTSGIFQSRQLLHWYQKYGHYWDVGDYQKTQYSRVKPILTTILPSEVSSFTIAPALENVSENRQLVEFVHQKTLVADFFQALNDMQFSTPTDNVFIEQWHIQISTENVRLGIECFLSGEYPTVVIGRIQSPAGYSYFQSQRLYQWYQTYRDYWGKESEG